MTLLYSHSLSLFWPYLWFCVRVLKQAITPCLESCSLMFIPFLCPQAFGQAYSAHRKVAADGESREESLMLESASQEALHQQKLLDLQNELRQAKASFTGVQAENDRLSSVALEIREVNVKLYKY